MHISTNAQYKEGKRMLGRRKFFLSSASLIGLAVINPIFSTSVFASNINPESTRDKFSALLNTWIALYDFQGEYITDVRLVKLSEEKSNTDLEQFALRWKIRDDSVLNPGTYVVEDFSNNQTLIYLEPSFSKRNNGKYYRASFSLLRQ